MEKMGQNFHICLRSGPTDLTPLTVSLSVKYPFFDDSPYHHNDHHLDHLHYDNAYIIPGGANHVQLHGVSDKNDLK